jgi:hypothetical protein
MGFTKIRVLNHSRKIGEKDGKAIYMSTELGVILRDENGVESVVLNYVPSSDGRIFCNKPKEKEEAPF